MSPERKQYGITIKSWDMYAGEGGEWVWKTFTVGEYTELQIETILDGLEAAGKYYFYGEITPQDANL